MKEEIEKPENEGGGPEKLGFNEEGVYDAADYRTIYTLVGNTKHRGVGDLFKRGLMAAFMLKILELTPFFFNGGSDPRNVKLQDKILVGGEEMINIKAKREIIQCVIFRNPPDSSPEPAM